MANVRCPMCSEINKADADKCAFCGARLKPLTPASLSSDLQTPDASSEDEEPEWLRELRSTDEPSSDVPAESSSESRPSDVPDWLARIREKAQVETSENDDETGETGEDQPDWMREIQGVTDQPEEDKPEEDDWLGRLQQDQPPVEEAEESDTPSSGDGEDWMSTLKDWQSGTIEETPTPEEADRGIDWLNELEDQPPSPTELPTDEDNQELRGFGLTGFLQSLESEETGDQDQPDSSEEEPVGEQAGWDFSTDQQAKIDLPVWDQAESGQEEGLPEWLGEAQADVEQEKPAPADQEDLPDWLSRLESESANVPDLKASSSLDVEDEGEAANQPDWTEELEDADQQLSSPEIVGEEELPDWFASLQASEQPRDVLPEEQVGETEDGDQSPVELPDWLSETSEFSDEQQQAALESIPQTEESNQEETALAEPAASLPLTDEDTPDWLRDFSAQERDGEDSPPGLDEEQEETPVLPELEGDQSLVSGDLPEWLSEESAVSSAEAQSVSDDQPEGEELAQAELPSWVRDMRPIESVNLSAPTAAESDQRVERAGPLSGLRGILPADEMVTRYRKPPVYSARLRISEKHRSQASLLESILEQETQPLLIPPERSHAPNLIGRILVAVLLLTVLVIPFIIPLGLEPAPMRTPPELEGMFQQIDQTGATERPVLLSFDFEPALAGEMYLTALPVVEHLMARNARLVVISTVPSGPVLAQGMLSQSVERLAEQQQTYDLAEMASNLGYLPGGTISLLEFARFPRQAAPVSITGDYEVWNQAVLQPVKELSDFAQVIVITDSAEIGRAWVEQVQPFMGDTPLFMISSAQAEPMLMPYVESGQIDGLTAGVLGGVLYSQWRQVGTLATDYWPSYQIGTVLAFVLVLLGGIYSGFSALLKRSGKDEA